MTVNAVYIYTTDTNTTGNEMKSTTATLIIGGAMFGALYATMIWMAL
jgi:hypothetical protein